MADVFPFRGVRYDEAVAGDLSALISPPYDVIDATMYEALTAGSPHNMARLDPPAGGSQGERGTAADADYQRAADDLAAWLASGALKRDDTPGFTLYEQTFDVAGTPHARTGLVAAVKLEAFGSGVRPHERTLAGPKVDRLNLMRATRANFGQIFSLYDDASGTVAPLLEAAKAAPCVGEAVDAAGVRHRVWTLTDPAAVEAIQTALKGCDILIADGHHRYETALAYQAENPDLPAAQSHMMTLVDLRDPGLVVLPTHRLVRDMPDFDLAALLAALKGDFDVEPIDGDIAALQARMRALYGQGANAIGLHADGRRFLLTLRDVSAMDVAPDRSDAWKRLDVAVLHELILDRALGITPEAITAQTHVDFIKDIGDALAQAAARVDANDAQALFLLNPTRVDDVVAVSETGERMPQKSTFFHPKVYAGLVMRCLDETDHPATQPPRKEPS